MKSNIDYTEAVFDHFSNPRNMGKMENPDVEAVVGNPRCGDVMKIYLKISPRDNSGDPNNNIIEDVTFQTMGCAAAIATSSMATVLAKGKTIDEVKKLTNQDVAHALGELPPVKMHCSNLAADALKKAIENWEKGLKSNEMSDEMHCH